MLSMPLPSLIIFLTVVTVFVSISHAAISDNKIKSSVKDNNVTIVNSSDNNNNNNHRAKGHHRTNNHTHPTGPCPCTCGVFLSGQFKKGSKEQPKGNPVLVQEMDDPFTGNKQCVNKCLELIVRHLSKSSDIICGMADRDCEREKAYLFIKNHSCTWHNSNLSAGKEYCCKDNQSYKCPRN